MANVNTTVSIRQGGGDGCTFKLFLFHIVVLSYLLVCFANLQISKQNIRLCTLFYAFIIDNMYFLRRNVFMIILSKWLYADRRTSYMATAVHVV